MGALPVKTRNVQLIEKRRCEMEHYSAAEAAIVKRAGETVRKLFGFLSTLPEKDHNGFSVLQALAWCTGHQVGAFPDECRAQMRELACDEMNGVVDVLEEDGEAGAGLLILTN
jgi:hypothetical protein